MGKLHLANSVELPRELKQLNVSGFFFGVAASVTRRSYSEAITSDASSGLSPRPS